MKILVNDVDRFTLQADNIGISADTPEELVAALSSPLLLSKTKTAPAAAAAAAPLSPANASATLPTEPGCNAMLLSVVASPP